ncbi:hypothetical protein AB0E63_26030 [Kribbella sp. NPDC026596]|uniref:hypothetical protein n=1 Tax=Kribbella sp. NPDC026596 TaxID=3155122 RepID=UPI00340B3D57
MTLLHRDDCTLSLTVGDRIEYVLDAGGQRIVVSTALAGIDALTSFLEQTDVHGADEPRLVAASRAAVERDGLARYYPASIRAELRRWCHQAGLSSDWDVDGKRTHREHIVAAVTQPGTGRAVTISWGLWTPGEGDEFSFDEEYRGPDEILGYSYGLRLPYDVLPQLAGYAEKLAGTPSSGDPEDRLIAACEVLLDPLAGQGALRDQVESWCAALDLRPTRRGTDRRETLVEAPTRPDQIVQVSFSIGSFAKRLGLQEGYGTAEDSWRDALYQLQFDYAELARLLPWLKNRVGPVDERLGPDDTLIAYWRALAERGELTPRRPMEVRDRVADWLTEAGVEFERYGSAWRETLLKVRRAGNDCIFTLSLTFDPKEGDKGITFTEFYDYLPIGEDPGREYGYSVHAPYDALDTLANAYAPGVDGPAQDRLVGAFKSLVTQGVLADGMALEANQELVLHGFEAAGVESTTSVWSWINSD